MKSKIYYGEYSLEHWIRLMLTGNIVRPEYQRSFVWEKEDVTRLIKALKDGLFVQPVTIALNRKDGVTNKNIILDGQQRLTSILLAKIGRIPDKAKFRATHEYLPETGSKDDVDENTRTDKKKKSIEWTFSDLLSKNGRDTIKSILDDITDKKDKDGKSLYIPLDDKIKSITTDDFFKETFLGFSYIVVDEETKDEPKDEATRYFAKIFKNMNYWGKKLSALESRRSLYYMNQELRNYFDGTTSQDEDVLCDIKLMDKMRKGEIDFVRYLSILSQYFIKKSSKEIMKKYASYSSRENFYADYVECVVGLEKGENEGNFNGFKFDEVFSGKWQGRLDEIHNSIERIKSKLPLKENAFPSYIDADYWLIGLIYWMLFEGKEISFEDELIRRVRGAIKTKKKKDKEGKENPYTRNPNALRFLRERVEESIRIYENFVIDGQS